MFSLPKGLDIQQIGGEHRNGLHSNLSVTGSVNSYVMSYITPSGHIGLKTSTTDPTQTPVDFTLPRRLDTYDTFYFGEVNDASMTSSIWVSYEQISVSSNYFLQAGYDNYGGWSAGEWKPLIAKSTTNPTGFYVGAVAGSFIGNARFRLNFARAATATDAANAPRVSAEFRCVGYAA